MDLLDILNVVSTFGVIGGLVFAGWQVRLLQIERSREAALQLIQNFQSPEFVEGLWLITDLPEGLSKAEVEARLGDRTPRMLTVMFALEHVGILVAHGEISIRLVQDVFSGPTMVSWRKLERYVKDVRAELATDTPMEYFQWLAERLAQLSAERAVPPAYLRSQNAFGLSSRSVRAWDR